MFEDVEEAEVHWGDEPKQKRCVTHSTSPYLSDYSWAQLRPRDDEVSFTTKELVKIYAPFFVPVLSMKVRQLKGSLSADFEGVFCPQK